jgi:hypothetical protein
MITPAKERMRKSRAHRRLGLRPVQVLVSEQDIDFLLARHYELTRTDDRSIGRAMSAFLSDLVLEGRPFLPGGSCSSWKRVRRRRRERRLR